MAEVRRAIVDVSQVKWRRGKTIKRLSDLKVFLLCKRPSKSGGWNLQRSVSLEFGSGLPQPGMRSLNHEDDVDRR